MVVAEIFVIDGPKLFDMGCQTLVIYPNSLLKANDPSKCVLAAHSTSKHLNG